MELVSNTTSPKFHKISKMNSEQTGAPSLDETMLQKNAVRGYFGDIFDELPKIK